MPGGCEPWHGDAVKRMYATQALERKEDSFAGQAADLNFSQKTRRV